MAFLLRAPSTPFFPATFVQNSLTGSNRVATWTAPCPRLCSLSRDVQVTQLGNLWCQRKAVCCVTEICMPLLPPHNSNTSRDRHTVQLNLARWGGFLWTKSLQNHLPYYPQPFSKPIYLFLLLFCLCLFGLVGLGVLFWFVFYFLQTV